jgi:hypothetical protein
MEKENKDTVESSSDEESGSDEELESDEASPRQPKSKKKSAKATTVPGKKKKSAVDLSTNTESRPEKAPASQSKGKQKAKSEQKGTGVPLAPYKKKKSAEELTIEARRINPEGVRVINRNIFDSAQVLAGYSGLPGTADLKEVLDSIKALLLSFENLRKQGFGIPDWSATSQVQVKVIFKTIQERCQHKCWKAVQGHHSAGLEGSTLQTLGSPEADVRPGRVHSHIVCRPAGTPRPVPGDRAASRAGSRFWLLRGCEDAALGASFWEQVSKSGSGQAVQISHVGPF